MFYLLSSVVLLIALVAVQATRDQYLVVLRWPVGSFLLERGADGRYTIVPASRVPLALLRYARESAGDLAQRALRRVRGRSTHVRVAVAGHR